MSVGMPVIDTAAMQRVGGQLGTNPAGIYQDARGRRYYVKTLESAAHARNETIAARLYRLAGAPTLTYVHTTAPDQIATQWVQLDKTCVAHFTEHERRQAQRWFGVHAWTANWDAAGFVGDNQGVLAGTVLTLDVGARWRSGLTAIPKGERSAPAWTNSMSCGATRTTRMPSNSSRIWVRMTSSGLSGSWSASPTHGFAGSSSTVAAAASWSKR